MSLSLALVFPRPRLPLPRQFGVLDPRPCLADGRVRLGFVLGAPLPLGLVRNHWSSQVPGDSLEFMPLANTPVVLGDLTMTVPQLQPSATARASAFVKPRL